MEPGKIHKTAGAIFENAIIELVSDGAGEGPLKLLLWDGAKAQILPRFEVSIKSGTGPNCDFKKTIFEPVDVDPSIRRAIRFPARADTYGSTRELFDKLRDLFLRYCGLPEGPTALLTYATIASWLPDVTEIPVSVAIVGPPSIQRRQLLRLLNCLVRQGLLLGDASLAGFCALRTELSPALLIERCENNRQVQKLLTATNSRDALFPWKGRLVNLNCAKMACLDGPVRLAVPGWNAIEIPVTGKCPALPPLDQHTLEQIADEFQSKLLKYRLTNLRRVRDAEFDVPEFAFPARDLARCLGACVPDDAELQAAIAPLLQDQNDQDGLECELDLRATVIEALLSLCHQTKRQSVYVAELSDVANEILMHREETFELSPPAVGNVLKALKIVTKRLSSRGRGFLLLNDTKKQIHTLAATHCFMAVKSGAGRCELCLDLVITEEARASQDEPNLEDLMDSL